MSAGSPKFTVSRIAALSLVSLWLAGCTSSSNPPAPVTSVDSGSSSNTNSGMLITPPPKMGATPQQAPQIQPVQRPVTQPMQTQPVTEQPVQMENGRIVYNRQYGNIPKGSYTGGHYPFSCEKFAACRSPCQRRARVCSRPNWSRTRATMCWIISSTVCGRL